MTKDKDPDLQFPEDPVTITISYGDEEKTVTLEEALKMNITYTYKTTDGLTYVRTLKELINEFKEEHSGTYWIEKENSND